MPQSQLMFMAAVRRWEKGVLPGGKKSPEAIHSLVETSNPSGNLWAWGRHHLNEKEKNKEKTTPFSINLMRSQVLYRAAIPSQYSVCKPGFVQERKEKETKSLCFSAIVTGAS